MVLPVTTANNVKVYTVSGGLGSRSIPDWLVRKKKKALKKDFGKHKKNIDHDQSPKSDLTTNFFFNNRLPNSC
jgi:hypothetical protein